MSGVWDQHERRAALREQRGRLTRACVVFVTVLIASVSLAPSASADRVVTGDRARFSWAPASGPVMGYRVYVSRNGDPDFHFFRATSADEASAVVSSDPGNSVQVIVRAWRTGDGGIIEGPLSAPSEVVYFVEPLPPPPEPAPAGESTSGGGGSGTPIGGGGTIAETSPPRLVAAGSSGAVALRWYDTNGELEIGDFNADGKTDLFLKNGDELLASFWLMQGDRVRRKISVEAHGPGHSIVGVGQFGAGGASAPSDDVLVYSRDQGLYLLWEIESGLVTGVTPLLEDDALDVIAIADFDGDSRSDLLMRHPAGDLSLWILEGGTPVDSGSLGNPGRFELDRVADFDADGRADILLRDINSGQLSIFLMDGTQAQRVTLLSSPGDDTRVADSADFDGDGDEDLLLQDADGQIRVWLLEDSDLVGEVPLGRLDTGSACGTGDFDANGVIDLVLCGEGGQVAVWLQSGLLE